ncbi:MAG: excinuclease ABC subunit UvrC [Bullifex sp.]
MSAKDQAHALPENPGIYMMKDSSDTVIYVGKARNLRRRVSSYFLTGRDAKTSALVAKIDHIDYIITGNEYEALVLENNLIKKYNPHYNILLKDGKSYPMIKITKEDYPRVYKTRRILPDGADYFGPFPQGKQLEYYLELIRAGYHLRLCSGELKKREKPCLYYHIHKCLGPCIGEVTPEAYGEEVKEIREFLSGNDQKSLIRLRAEMMKDAKELRFEEASKKRDLLKSLETVMAEQAVQDATGESRDYAAVEMRGTLCTVAIMQIRSGSLVGRALYRAETMGDETETLLSFLIQYYSDGDALPGELYVSHEIDTELLSRYFREELHMSLYIAFPKEGKHYRILRMAEVNASEDVEKRMCAIDNTPALERLRTLLDLDKVPLHIEGFDIAHLAGKYTVASLIVFKNGNPSVKDYRRFNIKSLDGKIDDFESMREAVTRRYTRLVNEKKEIPDLILIDGGKGQVHAAVDMLEIIGLEDVPVVGLAERNEELVFPDDRPNLVLDRADSALRVLIAVRDECHRFATGANQRMRSRDATFALLESIEGVGKARSRKIMETCGSVEGILELDSQELAGKCSVPLDVAERIIHKLTL